MGGVVGVECRAPKAGARLPGCAYAPTLCTLKILLYFPVFLPARILNTATAARTACKYRSHLSYSAQLSVAQTIENKEMHFTMRTVGEERCLPKKQVRSLC